MFTDSFPFGPSEKTTDAFSHMLRVRFVLSDYLVQIARYPLRGYPVQPRQQIYRNLIFIPFPSLLVQRTPNRRWPKFLSRKVSRQTSIAGTPLDVALQRVSHILPVEPRHVGGDFFFG